ncbi:MAG: hypothetical protein Q9191_001889 [Dirinaria sp. TL-2023a]
MAKDKDRTLNPAAAHRKQEKQKALKKGKAAVAASRTARLATRNPSRLERQIADLKAVDPGSLSARDKKQLQDLEAELARVKKARDARPDLVPARGGGAGGVIAGRKRGRDEDDRDIGRGRGAGQGPEREDSSTGSETDESVRAIPMPRDTPPPLPRRGRGNANLEPLGNRRGDFHAATGEQAEQLDLSLPSKPVNGAGNFGVGGGGGGGRTVYEAKPQVRDLKKEATARFVPAAVRKNLDASKGKGRLLEEEELEMLERAGYGVQSGTSMGNDTTLVVGNGDADEREKERRRLLDEEERFAREMAMEDAETAGAAEESISSTEGGRAVQMEEVEDEDL